MQLFKHHTGQAKYSVNLLRQLTRITKFFILLRVIALNLIKTYLGIIVFHTKICTALWELQWVFGTQIPLQYLWLWTIVEHQVLLKWFLCFVHVALIQAPLQSSPLVGWVDGNAGRKGKGRQDKVSVINSKHLSHTSPLVLIDTDEFDCRRDFFKGSADFVVEFDH